MAAASDSPPVDDIEIVLDRRLVHTLFQPLVDLGTGHVIGFEALSRGPQGSRIEQPGALFGEAARVGRLVQLDTICQQLAVRRAMAAGLSACLFVNAEPDTFARENAAGELAGLRSPEFDLVVEFTERSLARDPATLIAFAEHLRSLGCAIALDDVGAHPDSLALLPVLRPDVVKLDMALLRRPISADTMRVVHAVNAEAERSGCLIVAEGIETPAERDRARAFGATVGQGWLLGGLSASLRDHLQRRDDSFDASSDGRRARSSARRAPKHLLIEISRQLEETALGLDSPPIVLGAFQHARYFTPETRERYVRLAERSGFVGVLGVEIGESPAPGVRGSAIGLDDPLVDEWDVVVLSPHFAAALLARDVGDRGADELRRFDYVLTYDRDAVIATTNQLMSRIAPLRR